MAKAVVFHSHGHAEGKVQGLEELIRDQTRPLQLCNVMADSHFQFSCGFSLVAVAVPHDPFMDGRPRQA